MLEDQIGPMFTALLSLAFCGYGVRELAQAYRLEAFDEWSVKAFVGASGMMLSGLFAAYSNHMIGGTGLLGVVFGSA